MTRFIVLCILALFALRVESQYSNVVHSFSPKLRALLDGNPRLLIGVTNEIGNRRIGWDIQLYYFYSDDDRIPRTFHSYSGAKVIITVRENQEPLDEWLCFAFEILNSSRKPKFTELINRASAGTIAKSEFALEMIHIEFEALKEMRDTVGAWRVSTNLTAGSYLYKTFLDVPETFEEFKTREFKQANGKPAVIREYEAKYDLLRSESGRRN